MTLPPGIKNLAKWASALTTIGALVISIVAGISRVVELKDTITQQGEKITDLKTDVSTLATAVRSQTAQDREVITNLRVAVASLETALDYVNRQQTSGAMRPPHGVVSVAAEPPALVTARARVRASLQRSEAAGHRNTMAAISDL